MMPSAAATDAAIWGFGMPDWALGGEIGVVAAVLTGSCEGATAVGGLTVPPGPPIFV